MYFLFLSSSDLSLPYNLPRAAVISLSFSWPPTLLDYSLTNITSLDYCLYRTGFLSDLLFYRTCFLYRLWLITWHVFLGVLSCTLPAFFILLLLYFLSFLLFWFLFIVYQWQWILSHGSLHFVLFQPPAVFLETVLQLVAYYSILYYCVVLFFVICCCVIL